MRVISGEYGGRPLKSLSTNDTRPTTDKVKEAVFHMLGPYFDGGRCLDLYAGSGGLGIEAVSRGMDHSVLVDSSRDAAKVINENIDMTKEPEKFTLMQTRANQALNTLRSKGDKFQLILLDPPYDLTVVENDVNQLIDFDLVDKDTVLYCEVSERSTLPDEIGPFQLVKEKNYGKSNVYIYEYKGE